MKKSILLVLIFALITGITFAQRPPQVAIVNNTGYAIYYLYISQTENVWGDDALGSQIINAGSTMIVALPSSISLTDRYNIMAVGADGDAYIKWDALMPEGSRIEFTMADFNTDTELNVFPPQNMPQVTIINYTGYTLHFLYIKTAVSDSWGGDVLGERVLNSGYQININMPYPANVSNQYYVRAVDSVGDSYTKWNIIVTEGGKIYFVSGDID